MVAEPGITFPHPRDKVEVITLKGLFVLLLLATAPGLGGNVFVVGAVPARTSVVALLLACRVLLLLLFFF